MAPPNQGWRNKPHHNHSGRGKGEVGSKQTPCQNFQRTGHCRFGDTCHFSHNEGSSRQFRERPEETPEQQRAKADYNVWKRLIKSHPRANDIGHIRSLWTGALAILNGDDRDWKQMLPRDLDDQDLFGREHIQVVMSMVAHEKGNATFIDLARPFLLVFTHAAILDCLSVDTSVGGLYNFISGNNGTRAIPFFQRLIAALVENHLENDMLTAVVTLETTLIATATALRELLRREQRALFHDDLPGLIDSISDSPEIIGLLPNSIAFQVVRNNIREFRGMLARATGLLQQQEQPHVSGISTTAITSTYPKEPIFPRDRHDNDKRDIIKISILPTEDEIRSEHPSYLPSTDMNQPHFLVDQVERYLDTYFRLLRYDIFGELNEALGGVLLGLENDPKLMENPKFSLGNVRAYCHPQAHISYISFDQRRGLEAQISFRQPSVLRQKTAAERGKWWEESKRMDEGILLCLVAIDNGSKSSLIFFTISEKNTDPKRAHGLSSSAQQATITAKLATRAQRDLELVTSLSCHNVRGLLFEFPGVLLGTFVPILENIQNMQRLSRLPFRQWILPDRGLHGQTRSEKLEIPPPLYARRKNFQFSLRPILKESASELALDVTTSAENGLVIDELQSGTGLDRGQCAALIAALTREFAFIQGPPGTGKSYLGVQLMRVLLACKTKADLGPIVVVCYTNHALDQFLEHLLDVGIDRVIRIGGQSKSTAVEGKNLRIVSQGETKAKSEGYLLGTTYTALEQQEKTVRKVLGLLHGIRKRPEWASLRSHLKRQYPRIHEQFSRIDEEGYKTVGKHPFDIWLNERALVLQGPLMGTDSTRLPIDQILARASERVNAVPYHERCQLAEHWAQEVHNDAADELYELVKTANALHKEIDNVHDEVDRRVLQTADVIGVTTTGLARRIATLQRIRSRVVICEEAGEVMEPHMISALIPSVEHFIQIGDHEQLRPQINNFKLSLESQQGIAYQLDRSQFERLSVGQPGRPAFPLAQLNVQRRMRPEISTLIRETIYPRLLDHETTKSLPHVVGMRNNIFWLDHKNMEEGPQADMHQKSHSNLWEVELVHALVKHIVRQGVYSSTDIAVLTPYTGQLSRLRAKMRKDFEIILSERDQETLLKEGFDPKEASADSDLREGQPITETRPLQKKQMSELLRVATVDNFQGEEAKIVIVSLVRSNQEKKVGFLRTRNRINVLISRAQHGMYLIGNTDTYCNQPTWAHIQGMLRASDSVGFAIALCCPRHPDTNIEVSQPEDFARFSPEGGCQLACDRRLATCGHRCQARCHSENMHQVFACPQPCERLHSPCNHVCQKSTCGEDCGPCMIGIDDLRLPCSHTKDGVKCYLTQDLGKVKCAVPVRKKVPICKHTVEIPCSKDVTSNGFRCPTPCGSVLPCGHACPGDCGHCNQKDTGGQIVIKHQECSKVCGRRFATCNHTCKRTCHEGKECGPCPSDCEVRCLHSQCTLRCHEPCAPCIETCTWACEHQGACSMPCAAPCDRLPCNERCGQTLSCGHQCPGLCGETCSEGYCQICSNHKEARVDLLEMKTYGEIDLDDTPIAVLGCGHFFTAETLDGHMGMADVYEQDINGIFTSIRDTSDSLARAVPRCPDCQCPVRQFCTQRFNRVINRAVIDEMSKRFLVNGKDRLRELEQKITDLENDLANSQREIFAAVQLDSNQVLARDKKHVTPIEALMITQQLKERYAMSRKLEESVRNFRLKASDKHQPTRKLHDATISAARRSSLDESMTKLTLDKAVPAIVQDHRITFGARIAELHVQCIFLTDTFSISQMVKSNPARATITIPGGAPEQLAKPFFQVCGNFINDCNSESLPKLAVEASIYFARVARSNQSYCHLMKMDAVKASEFVKKAKELLQHAKELCTKRFQNVEQLRIAVDESIKLLRREWYEPVTSDEIAAIKKAMVSGSDGIASHSGHWYNCANGHTFAIGECGMPMELATCPECGAPVGGQSHQAVGGVTRAEEMEG